MRGWALGAALVGALAWAAPAAAAIDLGPGSSPSAVVDPAGTAYIVYTGPTGASYCRLPRNAKACNAAATFTIPDASGAPYVVRRPNDGALIVVQTAQDESGATATWMWYSLDGGTSFTAPAVIATGNADLQDVQVTPDGLGLDLIDSQTAGLLFQQAAFGANQAQELNLDPFVSGVTSGDDSRGRIAALANGTILAVDSDTDAVHWRYFGGGNPFDATAWATAGSLPREGDASVATGPRGTYVLLHRSTSAQQVDDKAPFALRSYDAKHGRLRAAKSAGEDIRPLGDASLAEDPAGRLHVISTTNTNAVGCVVYSRTSTRKTSWFGRSTTLFVTHASAHFPQDPQLAAGQDGRGVAVWDEDTVGHSGDVWVTPLKQRSGRYRAIKNPFKRAACPS